MKQKMKDKDNRKNVQATAMAPMPKPKPNVSPEPVIQPTAAAEPEPVNIPEPLPIKKMPRRFKLWQKILGGVAIVALLIGGIAYAAGNSVAKPTAETAAPVVKTATGQTTWQMFSADYGQNRWFADGITEIQSATTQADAVKAATAWLDKVKTDANLLVGAAKFFLHENVDKSTLVDANGYATDAAIQLTERISLALATSNIKVADAPADGINSATTADGTVVQADSAGISGDRKAIQITDKDGQSIWIMGRCGNPVTASNVGLPTGVTDNPTPSNPSTPSNPTNDLTPKSSNPADYPYPRGDDGTTDSGTGVKPPVELVTTPAETTPPAVEVTTPGGGGVVDTPTADPGSESGVTAPDVEQPATSTPVNIPVEPGANSGTNTQNNTTVDNPFL